jgi:signal transduction histidine kinase
VSPLGRRRGAWSLAAAGLLGAAALLFLFALAFRSSGVLYPIAAGLAALAVFAFLGGRLAGTAPAPREILADPRSDPPFESAAAAELEMLRERLAQTEGRQIAEGLNARLDALSGTEKEQQQFIADVSHELRTPLTVLRGTLEVALEEDRPAEEYREAIGNALLEIRHLARISQNILFLARGESGRVTLSFSNQDLARFVAEVTRELQPAATDHDLDLSVDVPAAPVVAFVDPGRMQQVLHNLIENAMRYTPPGGSVRVRLTTIPTEARIEVSDTGVGIPEADLPFVFERFFRSDRARRAYTGGSGLGLSIVRWIVEAHKGQVEISSVLDRGTTVTVRLPLVN